MNAFAMRLESRQPLTVTNEEKSKDLSGHKKCKSIKKKNSTKSDKDALLNRHGLGREFCNEYDLNCENTNLSKTKDSSNEFRFKKMSLKTEKMFSESDKIQERLQRSLCNEDKEKVMSILNEIKALSDIEKLFLYLQLPTGSSFEVDPFKQKNLNPLGKKADEEGLFAVTWIQSHLEEDPDVSLPKQEVYDEYQTYCSLSGTDPLCAADFGKVMKQIFPSVKPRRLGTRGNSRYCYSGLRKKLKLTPPTVPDLQKEKENSALEENICDEITSAACHILFEWAEKLLGIKFSSLKELATHLLENMYVDNRSVAAFTLLLDAAPQVWRKGCAASEGGIKKTEAQFHLQRKIQEKELIKEQKRKLQEQRSSILSVSKGKGLPGKKRVPKSRKVRDELICEEEKPIIDVQDPNIVKDNISENSDVKKCEEFLLQVQNKEPLDVIDIKKEDNFMKSSTSESCTDAKVGQVPSSRISKSPVSSSSSNSLGEMDDSSKRKTKAISQKAKSPVCIAQSLSGILIVPSLPQISADIGKQNNNPSKYKRIQPKPLQNELFSTVARARAGSVGSCLPLKPKSRTMDGRRSSHACLQSDSLAENGEEKPQKSNSENFLKEILHINSTLQDDVRFQTSASSENIININGKDISLEKSKLHIKPRLIVQSGLQMNNLSQVEDNNSVKRPLEENDDLIKNKRVHLESFNESRWIPKTGVSNSNSILKVNTNKHIGYEEVNVHEIEGDALIDYFRGANNHSSMSLSQHNELEQQISSSNKVQQLSQLRMLLEQNLPSAISKTTLGSSKTNKVSKSVDTSENIQSSISEDVRFQEANKTLSNAIFENPLNSSDNSLKSDLEIEALTLEKLLSSNYLSSDTETNVNNEMLSDPGMFLNCSQNNIQEMDINLQSDVNQNLTANDILLTTSLLADTDLVSKQINENVVYGRVNTYTQVPSVPQSPNTRRRAFNFMPISPRHTPIPDGVPVNGTSPHTRMMMSTAVGPSQPPSNSGSPFVSPRSTPVPLSRSRHSSGQSTYSTSCHTPFQNFDSGVSSVSSSPFISPQPTPVPVSRLRHNSNHASSKTVTFSSVNSPQVIHPHSASSNIRTRHSSGPGAHHLVTSPRSSSLSPLVAEQSSTQSFVFPSTNELRSRHSSGSNATTPLSPVSEQASSSSSCASSNIPDLSTINDVSQSFLNDGAGDLLISANPSSFKQVRHRHVSGSVIYGKSSYSQQDIFSQEIQKLLKNSQNMGASDLILSNRSQSVPLHQMLQTADGLYFLHPVEDSCPKSQPSTPVMNQMFSFPTLNSNTEVMDVNNQDKSINQNSQMEWSSLDSSHELETSSARRNLATLYDAPPLSDDLQTTLEDLRDCDTDFSKLEMELRQTEESGL